MLKACKPFYKHGLQAASKSVAMVCTSKGMTAVIDALVPPTIITKLPMPSVLTKQILSMVDAVMCPIYLDSVLHQPIQLPCHAYMFVVGVLRHGFVSLYD